MRLSFTAATCLVLTGSRALANIISTNGFQSCNKNGDSTITVQGLDIAFDRATNMITFDVAGTSTVRQEVTASLSVTAYGILVYNNSFDPCAAATKVDQLCPVPAGQFSARGSQQVPTSYADKIPAIAYTIPDLDGSAQMVLQGKNGQQVACIQSAVTNGKSVEVPAVSYVAAAMAAAALALSVLSAGMAGGQPGASQTSPGFTEVILWFQSIAMDGMMSINYPGIYRSFTKNFGFSTGLIQWGFMQSSIDKFRAATGGNITDNNYDYLRNVTLVYGDSSAVASTKSLFSRSLPMLTSRQNGFTTTVNGTASSGAASFKQSKVVVGIQAYAEQLAVPNANIFMNVLLAFALVTAVIVVAILLLKVILEAWSLIGRYPKSLTTFRKEYWRIMAQAITSLIFLLYGVWVLYCIYQFTHGDSWVAKLLAGVTLAAFTAILAYYTWRIWSHVQKVKRTHGTTGDLFDNKETWKKYSLFYASYKASYWWLFMPTIVYMFAKGCVLAGGDGHGLVQSIGQLGIETIMLILLLWSRPYNRKSSNWINIVIQIVRVVSIGLIIVFVTELGIKQSTKTITGVVLIGVQAGLTGILALLIVINAAITCCKENPHRRRRKATEKARQAPHNLEGDAFLMEAQKGHKEGVSVSVLEYDDVRAQALHNQRSSRMEMQRGESEDLLLSSAASIGGTRKGGYQPVHQSVVSYESPAPSLPPYSYNGYSNELQHQQPQQRAPDSDYIYGGPRQRMY